MKQIRAIVIGMHCVSCSNVITRKIKKLDGVSDCSVNYATEQALISFDPEKISVSTMNDEVKKYGYSLRENDTSLVESSTKQNEPQEIHTNHNGNSQSKSEKLQELNRLLWKVKFALPIAIGIFIIMLWDIATKVVRVLPTFPVPMDILNPIQFLFSLPVLFWVGKPYIEGIVRFVRYRIANMDTLVGIGTFTAFIYSTVVLLFPSITLLLHLPDYTYFDVTIVVVGFVTFGKYLEARSKLQTGDAIEQLLHLQAKTAIVLRVGVEFEVPISDVVKGDLIVVKPGSKIPVDGIITLGNTSIDESMVTGEPIPNDKNIGDIVIGGTMNKQGRIVFCATKIGSDSMLAQIIQMVAVAQGSKAHIQNLADKISEIFVPVVLGIAFTSLITWILIGSVFIGLTSALSFGLLAFVGVLVIACPCALGLATPTAIIVGVGIGATKGILIKNAESLERLSKVNTIVFDKTGTITIGKPSVTDIIVIDPKQTDTDIFRYASSVEKYSSHPLAGAIVEKAEQMSLRLSPVSKFEETEGIGVEGYVQSKFIRIRKPQISDMKLEQVQFLQSEGKTVVIIEMNKRIVGCIGISDMVKTQSSVAVKELNRHHIQTILLTGDSHKAAEYIARQVKIEQVIADVLPQDKAAIIKQLQTEGKIVAMVGDGINDAPALTQANVGIAMATGTDIAIESSDITLIGGDVSKIPQAINLSKKTIRTIKQNLFWAFIFNSIGIPLAAGALYPIFGIFLNPVFAGLAMAFSSVSVVTNSLLLRKIRI